MSAPWRRCLLRPLLGVVAALLLAVQSVAAVEITLKNSFIDEFKDRATISTQFTVDKAHAKPNPPSKDGDLHIAGRAPEIGLMSVAEIMNAASDKPAVATIHTAEGTGQPIALVGAWRIWCEHGGSEEHMQEVGILPDPATGTNPDHVFEVHPVTVLEGHSLAKTLKKTGGYKYKDAETAFQKYESVACELKLDGETTIISTKMAGYNYVDFLIEPLQAPKEVDDGYLVLCAVYDLKGELLVHKRRMVFVKGSTPAEKLLALPSGKRMRVIGIPRINLYLVWYRTRGPEARPEMLSWDLPYEMIVAGFVKYVSQ